MKLPRLVWGETSRERELRALVEGLQAECERKNRRIAADRDVHERAVSALRDAVDRGADGWNQCQRLLESAKAQRNEARRERDEAVAERDEERIKHARMVSVADDFAARLAIAEHGRLTLSDVASSLRALLEAIETEDSPEDRPATDSGAEGAGTTPE